MPDIYIISDYGKLYRKSDTFHFNYPDGTVSKFFPHNTEKIFIIGKIEITADAFRMLSRYNIEVIFLNRNGRFNGKLVFNEGKNVLLRQKQYLKLDKSGFKVGFCRSIVEGKVKNQLVFANRIRRERNMQAELEENIAALKSVIQKAAGAPSVDALRGYEGYASRTYFSVFKHGIMPGWAEFNGRSMNPPLDNVNAVMSFLYTLLNQSVESQVLAEGLDSFVGYLHSPEYGRKSLVFDLMEEFRVPVCDTLVLSLFNRGIIKENDFRKMDFSEQDDEFPLDIAETGEDEPVTVKKGVLLTREGLKKVIPHFEKKMEDKYYYQPLQTSMTFRRIIAEQVKHFKRIINDEEKEYSPFTIR